jgi:putative acetyltransferase
MNNKRFLDYACGSARNDREMLDVRLTDPFAAESVRLIGELWQELSVLYPGIQEARFRPTDISGKRTAFIIAWLDGAAVGCGAFQPLGDDETSIAEITRMYIQPSARGCGIARAILMKLAQLASNCGYDLVRLETGTKQPDAIHLSETDGYHRIDPYGRHAEDPMSVCFEKTL